MLQFIRALVAQKVSKHFVVDPNHPVITGQLKWETIKLSFQNDMGKGW